MAPLHPELAQLKDRFESLLDDYEAGHIDYETADTTLKSLVAIDGTGAQWTLDEEGNFLRGMPGGPKEPADPVAFRPAQLPMRSAVPNMPVSPIPSQAGPSAPWAAQGPTPMGAPVDLHTPPTGFLAQSPGAFDPMAAPLGAGPDIPGFPVTEEETGRPRGAKGPASRSPKAKTPKAGMPKRPGAGKAAKQSSGPGLVTSIVDRVASIQPATFLQGRGKTVLIAVVCAVVLFVGYTQIAGGDDSSPSGIPTTGVAADMPADGGAPTSPNGDQVTQLITALQSGDPALAAGAVQNAGSPLVVTQNAAFLNGLKALNVQISPGPVNGTVQDWTLMRGEEALGTAKVTYVVDGETWKIAEWPVFGS